MIELHKISAPGLLSTLTIDGNKDWGGYNITNFGSGAHDVDSALTLSADHISGATEDHSQYLLLAGRAGGQTAIGGTGSGEDLVLQSTSHATRGSIIIKTASGQSSNLLEFHTSGDVLQGFVDDDGSISIGTSSVTANRTLRLWGTAIISSRHTSIGIAAMLIEKIQNAGTASAEGLKTDVSYQCKSGDDPVGRRVRGAHYHLDIRDRSTHDLAGKYMAGYFEMEPQITNGNTITGEIYGFDFYYKEGSHHGTAPLVSGIRFREIGLQRATAVLTEVRYIDIATTAYFTTHAGTITNCIGIDIGDIDKGGTLNYALRTQAGDILLNGGNGQCDLILKGANYNLIETDSSDDELYLCKDTSSKLSIFNVTPIAQAAHIADADGTLASVTAQFNALLANVIEPFGFTATS